MKEFKKWGKQVGIRALEELYYILRDEIPMEKFYWQTFFAFARQDGSGRSLIVPDGKVPGEVLLECLNGNQEFCGSQGCVAGWACSTHPHLLAWVKIPGIGEELVLASDAEYAAAGWDGRDYSKGEVAFADAFEIECEEAHRIIYGFDGVSEDEEEEKGLAQAEYDHMLEVVEDVLSDHGIQVQAQRPDYLA